MDLTFDHLLGATGLSLQSLHNQLAEQSYSGSVAHSNTATECVTLAVCEVG